MDKVADLMVELIKAERDKKLIEMIRQYANPDKPIDITEKTIKLTEKELEKVFDKIDASEEERAQWKKAYYDQ